MDKIEREIAFTNDWYSKNKEMPTYADAIEWTDKEHGKELMYAIQKTGERTKREVINKACEYLRTHLWQNVDADNDPIVESVNNITMDNFINDFEKTMEEEKE